MRYEPANRGQGQERGGVLDRGEALLEGADHLARVRVDDLQGRDARERGRERKDGRVDEQLRARLGDAGGVVDDGAEIVGAGDEGPAAAQRAHAALRAEQARRPRARRGEQARERDARRRPAAARPRAAGLSSHSGRG
jgi:hypothetical protein